jgi:MFS family permease
MNGLITDYLTPYALWLKASTRQIGLLSAVPSLVSSMVQLSAPDVTEKVKSRKKVVVSFVYLQALMLLPMMLIPFLMPMQGVTALIVFVALFNAFSAVATPAWSSLISEYVPMKKRGKYFAWRARVLNIITITFALVSGVILFMLKGRERMAFSVILTAAFISRIVSWYFLNRMYEPPFTFKHENYFSLYRFIARFRQSNYAKFVVFIAFFYFSVYFAAPFFPVFMLRDLKLNYLTYFVLNASVTATNILTLNRWGHFADHVGNLRIIRFTAFFIASLPILWIINRHPLFLLFAQIVSGFAWSGFNLCVSNFIYDAVTPGKRTRCIAYFNVFASVATFLGATAGGFCAAFLPPLFGFKLLSLFLIAGVMRFFVAGFLLSRIREVRHAVPVSSKELFYSVLGFNPFIGATQDVGREKE